MEKGHGMKQPRGPQWGGSTAQLPALPFTLKRGWRKPALTKEG